MQIRLIVAMVIALLAVIFALQNAPPVAVNLLFWQFNGSLALILLGAVFVGVLLSLLLAAPSTVRRRRTRSAEQKRIQELEKGIADREAKIGELEKGIVERDAKLQDVEARVAARPAPPQPAPEPALPGHIKPPSDVPSR